MSMPALPEAERKRREQVRKRILQRKRLADEKETTAGKQAAGLKYLIGRISYADLQARLAEIPEDTRSLTARMMGDPLPGRSALDRHPQGD